MSFTNKTVIDLFLNVVLIVVDENQNVLLLYSLSIPLGFMFPPPSVLVPPSPSTQPIPCKFFPSCTKADCPFYHPQPKVQ